MSIRPYDNPEPDSNRNAGSKNDRLIILLQGVWGSKNITLIRWEPPGSEPDNGIWVMWEDSDPLAE